MPMLDGEVRDADVGLFFDARDLRVRRNYPGPAPC
jgi:hypothetical protein